MSVPRSQDTGLQGLVLMARLHGVPAEASALREASGEVGAPLSKPALCEAARQLGLKAKWVRPAPEQLPHLPFPVLAPLANGEHVVLAGLQSDQVLIQAPGAAPTVVAREAFLGQWQGEVLLAHPRSRGPGETDNAGRGWWWSILRRHRAALLEVLIATGFLQLLSLAAPLFFQVVIDKVLAYQRPSTLDVLCVGLLLCSGFEIVLGALRQHLLLHTATRLDVALGARVWRHLLRLPLAWFEARRVGDTVACVREMEHLRAFLTGPALMLVIDLLFACGFFALLVCYHASLTAVVAVGLVLQVLMTLLFTPVFRARLEDRHARSAEAQAFLVESVSGIATLKAAAVEVAHTRRWDELLVASGLASQSASGVTSLFTQGMSFLQKLTTVATLWLGARLVMSGALTVGELVGFNLIAARIAQPVLRLAQCWQELQQAGVSLKRLGTLMHALPEPERTASHGQQPPLAGQIAFDSVQFRYRPQGPDILRGLSFECRRGTVLAIVGPSGSGKSTIAGLLQRLHVPQGGRILLDGQNLALLDPQWLRRQIGVVLQENRLFNRSVRENIALREPGMPMASIVAAAQLAGAHEFILGLPEGYDTMVGEQGVGLSGGQRQRIALARALVTDPRLLILDEATSALDYDTEQIINQNLRQIARGRTVLLIAHRLSAVCRADRILVLDEGQILEQGTHPELVARGGAYARLWALQARGAAGFAA